MPLNQPGHWFIRLVHMDGANETVGFTTTAGGRASAMMLDVTDRTACTKAAAEIAKGRQYLDPRQQRRHQPSQPVHRGYWDDVLSINLDGVFNVTHAFID